MTSVISGLNIILKGVTVTLEVEERGHDTPSETSDTLDKETPGPRIRQWDLTVPVCNSIWARVSFSEEEGGFWSRLTSRTGLRCPGERGRVEREVVFLLENITWMQTDKYGQHLSLTRLEIL